MATDSLRYVKFIKIHYATMILGGIHTSYPQNLFFLGPSKKMLSSIDYSEENVILYKAQEERKIIIGH